MFLKNVVLYEIYSKESVTEYFFFFLEKGDIPFFFHSVLGSDNKMIL